MRNIIPYILKYRMLIAIVIIMILFSVLLGLIPPWLTRYIIDDLIKNNRIHLIGNAVLAMIGLTFLKGIIDFVARYLMEYIGENIIHNIRTDLYEHLSKQSFSFFDSAKTGDITSRVTSDADTLKALFGFGSVRIMVNVLTLVGILAVMFSWNYKLTLIYLIIVPLIIHAMKNYATKVSPVYRQSRRSLGILSSHIRDGLLGIEVIKLFTGEDKELQRFNRHNENYYILNVKGSKIASFWIPYVSFIVGIGTALVILFGGYWVAGGEISLGELIGLLGYMGMLTRPVRQTGMLINLLSRSQAAADRIFEVMQIEPEVKDLPGAYSLTEPKGKVEFSNVTFSYNKGHPILKDLSFTVEPGEKVALVGPSGAGKTTLLQLMVRFYEPDRGEILLDGHNIKNITKESLRKNIGIVMQDSFLFSTSIKENISFGKPGASMEEIIEAARKAQIHDFIASLPDGYQTLVGERGLNLSGGQRQRLAIARTLLMDPKILMMDEPTASVDAETEWKINKAFKEVMKGRTTFIISHRLWTVKDADKIIVLDDGRIVQMGSHEELLKKNGFYQNMWFQFRKGEVV